MSSAAVTEEQKADSELNSLRQTALSELEVEDVPEGLFLKDDVLLGKWCNPWSLATDEWSVVCQVVSPPSYQPEVLCLAQEAPMAGHAGIWKTQAQIMAHSYWPWLHNDVVNFCQTCHVCQVVGKSQLTAKPTPPIPIPAVGKPFSRVLVDRVGPLPRTRLGRQFLLTIIDVSTRFPEAVPLKCITSKDVVEGPCRE